MNKSKLLGGVTVLLSITVLAQPAWGNWAMACNGQRCGGDGGHDYVYIVRNISGGSLTLTSVCVGTEDGTALNYGFVNPPGFTATVVANDGTLPCNLVMDTDQTFTAHKTAHPPTTGTATPDVLVTSAKLPSSFRKSAHAGAGWGLAPAGLGRSGSNHCSQVGAR